MGTGEKRADGIWEFELIEGFDLSEEFGEFDDILVSEIGIFLDCDGFDDEIGEERGVFWEIIWVRMIFLECEWVVGLMGRKVGLLFDEGIDVILVVGDGLVQMVVLLQILFSQLVPWLELLC